MARTFTVGDLVLRAQQRADMENSSLLSTSEWKQHLSSLYAQLYAALAATGLRYFESTQSITSTGVTTYALPADHLSTISVEYVDGDTRISLPEVMAQERNALLNASGASQALAYSLAGAYVELLPTPATGQSYSHLYVPQPADLSSASDGTSVDVVTPDGEQFLVWGMAALALAKEESDTSLAREEREAARMRLEEWATLRYLHATRRVTTTDPPYDYREGDYLL